MPSILYIYKQAKMFYNLIVFAALEDTLKTMNASDEVINWFSSIEDQSIKGKIFAEFKKNQSLTIEQLNSVKEDLIKQIEQKEKSRLEQLEKLLPENITYAMSVIKNESLKYWIKSIVYKKYNNDLSSYDKESLKSKLTIIENWFNSIDKEELNTFNLSNFTFEQMLDMVERFEDDKKSATQDDKQSVKQIVYGPNWNNNKFNGFVIVELDNKQQLIYESNYLKHCVGESDNYIDKIKNGTSRIFSLRTSNNIPLVTIETSPDMYVFKQTFATSNQQPNSLQMSMINEWKLSLHPTEELVEKVKQGNSIEVAQFVSRGVHDELIDELLKSNDIGEESIGSAVENKPQSILQALSQNDQLNESDYYIIFEKGKESNTILFNLGRNIKTPWPLYLDLINNSNSVDVLQGCYSSINVGKLSYEIINKYLNLHDNYNKRLINIILNNPSIKSNITKQIILDYNPKINPNSDYEPKFINDYLSVKGYEEYEKFGSNILNAKDEDLKEIAKVKEINFNPKLRNEFIGELALKSNYTFIDSIVSNENTSPETLKKLSNSKYTYIVDMVSKNQNTPVSVLKNIIDRGGKDDEFTHCAVTALKSNKLDFDYLFNLFKSMSDSNFIGRTSIVEAILKKHNVPDEILITLANEGYDIFDEVESLSSNVLNALSNFTSHYFLEKVVKSENVTPEILNNIIFNNEASDFTNYDSLYFLRNAVRNKKTTTETLMKILDINESIDSTYLLYDALSNPNVPASYLEKYSISNSHLNLFAIANNKNSDEKVLLNVFNSVGNLTEKQIKTIIAEVLNRKDLSDAFILECAKTLKNEEVRKEIISAIGRKLNDKSVSDKFIIDLFNLDDVGIDFVIGYNIKNIDLLKKLIKTNREMIQVGATLALKNEYIIADQEFVDILKNSPHETVRTYSKQL